MAPLPKKKSSKKRTRQRREKALRKMLLVALTKCPKCQKVKLPHRECPHCGFYRQYKTQ